MVLVTHEWWESFSESEPTTCGATEKHLPPAFQHNPSASLITHQISHLANFTSRWPASGITAHLVKKKLCCCSSVKDRTSGSSNQANQTLSTWCILHLHCCLFLLPKTSEISLLCGKSESIIYKSEVTVPFVFISLFSEASSCDKIEGTWSWGNWESVSVSLPVLFPMVRNQYLGCCLHTYIGSLVKTRKHRPTARPPWILQPLYFLFCLLPSLIDFFFFLLNLSSVKRGFFCSLLHLRLHSLPSFVCIFCLFYYR